ncbi:MAG: hypothetical protein OXH70_17235 [Acidobacteria bacterium]|nr:hypothetical protein [Acidobacteriota bacterium]
MISPKHIDFTFDESLSSGIDLIRRLCGDTDPSNYRLSDTAILSVQGSNDYLRAARCRNLIASRYDDLPPGWDDETESIRKTGLSNTGNRVVAI